MMQDGCDMGQIMMAVAGCINRCCCPSSVLVQFTVAAADASSAAAINSSLIQSVLGSNAMATCLEVTLLYCAVQCCAASFLVKLCLTAYDNSRH